jgi:hypothetical protein
MIPSHRLPRRFAVCLLATASLAGCANGGRRVEGATPTEVSATSTTSTTSAASSLDGTTSSDGSSVSSTLASSGEGGSSTTAAGSSGSSGPSGSVASTPSGGSTSNTAGSGSGGGTATTAAPATTVAKTTPPAPQVRTWTVAYGSAVPTLTAHLGDEIVLTITSVEEQEFHVHPPYDIVLGGTKVTFDFTADQPGTKIVVESHTHPGVVVCYLTVL